MDALARGHTKGQGVVLGGSIFILLLSLALSINTQGNVAVRLGVEVNLPRTCLFQAVTGVDCPFCGLTRSFVALAHLHVRQAFLYHLAGPFLFAMVLLQVPFRLWQLRRARLGAPVTLKWFDRAWWRGVGAIVVAGWIANLISPWGH